MSPAQRQLRAVIYNRASADKAGQRVSVESQNTENQSWCEREGWAVAATITDNDRSATRYASREREGFLEIAAGLEGGRWGAVDLLVMWESSRGERTLDGHVALRRLCERSGVRLAYKGRILNMADGDDRFTAGLDALLDEREAERARERTLRSHRDSVAHGKPRGVTPFGYRREYEPGSNRLLRQLPDPETAPVVAELVEQILVGQPLYRIAQDLNRRGVPTPRGHRDRVAGRDEARPGWTSSIIRNLLRKPSLMGMRSHHGRTVGTGMWEPIVSPGDWAAVQRVFADPSRGRSHSGVAPRHLLSGVATCGVCGGWMRPMLNAKRMTYVCAGTLPTAPKGHVARDAAQLDSFVTLIVAGRMACPDFIEVFAAAAEAKPDVRASERELVDVRARLAEFEASAATGGITPAAFGRIEGNLLERIATLERATASAPTVPPLVRALAGPDALDQFRQRDLRTQRAVIRLLVDIQVLPVTKRGSRQFDPDSVRVTWRGEMGGA